MLIMFYAIVATILVSLISLIGVVFLYKKEQLHSNYGGVLISVAAGVMLATAILDLLPEALKGGSDNVIYWVVLLGIVFFFVLERFLSWHHHGHEDGHEHDEIKPSAYLILIGDGLHNFFDGIAIATAFMVSIPLGVAMTFAVITHEIPQEIADFVVLINAGMSTWKALWYNFLSGLTAVLGAILGWTLISIFEWSLPYLIAFNAGMFIYISCSDMIPALHEEFKARKKWLQTLTFIFGIVLMGVMGIILKV